MSLLTRIVRELKHLPGWHCSNRYIAFAVDDYGSVRVANAAAVDHLRKNVPGFGGQMDEFDSVETRQDLESLFETLSRHTDASGRRALITAYSLAANPDFECMRQQRVYGYESLAVTFQRLAAEDIGAYEGTWEMWRQGVTEGLIRPQFHGREHFSVPLIEWKLRHESPDLAANLEVDSMAGLSNVPDLPGVGFTHAFGLHDLSLLKQQREIIADGLRLFEEVFGFPSATFTPPALKLHSDLDGYVGSLGVKSIDKPLFGHQPAGNGKIRRSVNFLKPPRKGRGGKVVRTLSFEPCSGRKADPVGQALREIETAFRWRKPAIISSHRVNYAGHIDPANRKRGLEHLDRLLAGIRKNWPDAQFVSVDELVDIMESGTE